MNTLNNAQKRFTVRWFVNNELTYTIENVTAEEAYDQAISPEAFQNHEGNRWHVVLRQPALELMRRLEKDKELKVCYQDPHVNPEYDTERIVIYAM